MSIVTTKKPILTLTASTLALSWAAGPAFAQSLQSAGLDDDAPADTIIVTGLKRNDQTLVDAPASISVVDGDTFEALGADSLQDALQLAPGVSIDRNLSASSLNIQIRGVNTTFGSGSVGFYLDEIPFGFVNFNIFPDPNPYDLEGVEVLKGPQGTLYGAGSSGGVVLVKTRDPVLDAFEAKMDSFISTTEDGGTNYSTSAALNVPIIEDVLALRGVISYQDNSGWIDDPTDPAEDINDDERVSGRLKLLYQPTDELSVRLLGVISRIDGDFATDEADDSGNFPQAAALASANAQTPGFLDSFRTTDYDQFGATITYEFPWFTAQNTFGYIDFRSENTPPARPNSAFFAELDAATLTNELRLNSSHEGPFSWVLGGFFRDTEQELFQDLVGGFASFGLPDLDTDDTTTSTQFSVFGEGTLELFDGAMEVSAGVSYFNDETENDVTLAGLSGSPLEAFVPGVVNDRRLTEVSTDIVSPQASIAYHPTEFSTLFFRYARGFRPASVEFGLPTFIANISGVPADGTFDEETIDAYEFGAKGEFFDGRLYLEGNLFLNDIQDVQQSAAVQVPGGPIANIVLNAGEARARGAEWTVRWSALDELSLFFSGSYTEAEITDDFFAPGTDPATADPIFADGTRLNLVPEVTMNAGATYVKPTGIRDLDLTATFNLQYASDRALTVLSAPSLEGDDTLRTDLRLELGNERWGVYVFGENLNNEDGVVSPASSTFEFVSDAPAIPLDGIIGTRLRPRTIGGGVRLRF